MSPCQSRWCAATFSTTAASGRSDWLQYSWKLDSSAAMTGYGSGSVTASMTGRPTLPAAMLRCPAAVSMAASISTVVVLPLVPVTPSHSCRPPPGSAGRSRQASSTSPITGMPAAAAAATSGLPGRNPGAVTTRSVPDGSAGCSVNVTGTPRPANSWAARRLASSSRPSTAVTSAPRAASRRATGGPVIPRPLTKTRSPARRPARPGTWASASSGVRIALHREPGHVEDAEAGRDEQAADQPESDHDRGLGPAEQLEVMLERGHLEDPAPGQLVRPRHDDHREDDDHEQAAQDHEQQLGLCAHGQPGEHAAERDRPGVAHEDLGRRGVPPQEAKAGAEHRPGDHREVERVPHRVAL